MLRLPSDHERAGVFDLFLEDPTIEPGIRAAFREAIMNGTIPSTETEYRTATERVLAEGERRGERKGYRRGMERGMERGKVQGIEQGKVQGIELARRTVIERIRVLLGDEAAASLEAIADFDALSARAFEMLAEQR
jgi:flagellar biosynthesis/type III secretory pathway protein FliH